VDRLSSYLGWFGEHLGSAVFASSVIDAVGLPFPGRLVLVAAGALASTPYQLASLALLGTAGSLVGDHLLYAAGAFGGSRLLDFSCRVSLASSHCAARTLRRYERLGGAAVLLGRFSMGVRLFAAALAGSGRVGYWRFLLYDGLGSLTYAMLLLLLGHLFGARVMERAGLGGAVLLVGPPLALAGLIAWRLARRFRHGPATAERIRGPRPSRS
jgi:membrane protein DedA with SNARE-associated domain